MSNPNRDDQFAGWASAVLSKMFEATKEHTHGDSLDLGSEEAQQAMLQVVARAAYDLVTHTLEYVFAHPDIDDCLSHPNNEPITLIPDLVELPEENNTSTA